MKEKEKKEEKPLVPVSVEKANEIVNAYFGFGTLLRADIYYNTLGALVVNVSYKDFKPERTVRDELERMLPFSTVTAERDISFREAVKAFIEMWEDCEEWEVLIEGEMKKVCIRSLFYMHLKDKKL